MTNGKKCLSNLYKKMKIDFFLMSYMLLFIIPYLIFFSGKVYLDPKALKQHIKQVHEKSEQLHCVDCEFIFSSKYALSRHVKEVHNRRQEHTCTKCSKQFTQQSNLKQHMLIHIGAKPFPCADCKSAFTTKQCLQVGKNYMFVSNYTIS